MRMLESNSAQQREAHRARRASPPWQGRSAADATSVLLELARGLRALAAYEEAPGRHRAVAERAFDAVAADVARAGPLELTLRGETLDVTGIPERLDARGGLAILQRALARHAIDRLRVDAELTLDALQAFLDLLSRRPVDDGDTRSFVLALATRDARGLVLNDAIASADGVARSLDATPVHPSLCLTTPLVSTACERARETEPPAAPTPTNLARDPLATPAREDRGERLRARLIELDHTLDDAAYAQRAAEIVTWAREVWQRGLRDDCHRAMLVLADHAVGGGGRAESQARIAAARFDELAVGDRLEDLIDRALASDESGVRAAQLLLQRKDAAVPALIERICAASEPLESSALHALVLTCGEDAIPSLLHGINGHDEVRARVSIRLAGALQSPALLPALAATARDATLGRQVEAIRALCLLPGEASQQALAEALSSQLDQIAIAATEVLALNTGIDAVPALLDVLEAHVRGSRTQLCRAVIEVLGRLGDERAVPRLAAILERRPVLRRAHWHAIQLAAVDALCVLPTREARRAVERAASFAPAPVRDRARARLSGSSAAGEAR